jgi:hypothetical protein
MACQYVTPVPESVAFDLLSLWILSRHTEIPRSSGAHFEKPGDFFIKLDDFRVMFDSLNKTD